MEKKTAFVAYSFDDPDRQKVRTILDFLNSFREIGFIWESAERAEVESVSSKVRAKIDRSEVFVGILTRRHPVVRFPLRLRDIPAAVRGRSLTQEWTAPPWILQEVGYALKGGHSIILFREDGVEVPGLQGDLEYIPFDPESPSTAFLRASEMIHGYMGRVAGVFVEPQVSTASTPQKEEET